LARFGSACISSLGSARHRTRTCLKKKKRKPQKNNNTTQITSFIKADRWASRIRHSYYMYIDSHFHPASAKFRQKLALRLRQPPRFNSHFFRLRLTRLSTQTAADTANYLCTRDRSKAREIVDNNDGRRPNKRILASPKFSRQAAAAAVGVSSNNDSRSSERSASNSLQNDVRFRAKPSFAAATNTH
jgi:hypothetical protein